MSYEELFRTIVINGATGIVSGLFSGALISSALYFWFRRRIDFSYSEKTARLETERDRMEKFLEAWYNRYELRGTPDGGLATLTQAMRGIAIRCPDTTVHYLSKYLEAFIAKKDNADIYFGKALLSYRKTLGYKNRWWRRLRGKRVSPQDVARIYEGGNNYILKQSNEKQSTANVA